MPAAPCTNITAGPSSPRLETRRSNSPARPTSPHAGPATASGGIVAVTCALAETVRPQDRSCNLQEIFRVEDPVALTVGSTHQPGGDHEDPDRQLPARRHRR